MSESTLPIAAVNLDDFICGNATKRAEFVQEIGDSFVNIGFAAIKGGSLSEQLQHEVHAQIQQFFALADDIKEQYAIPDIAGQRGYNRLWSEQAKGGTVADIKEFWHHGRATDTSTLSNINVAELPAFTSTLQRTFVALEQTAIALMEATALFLKLPQQYFSQFITAGLSLLRAIHYPPITSEPQDAIRAAAHEDINLITLLVGASATGLQVCDTTGAWYDIDTPSGYLIVNVGDMLQRLTNGYLPSTTHRVINPPRRLWHTSRYSLPFFFHPIASMDLRSLDAFITATRPKQFSNMTAGEYLTQRLREIRTKTTSS